MIVKCLEAATTVADHERLRCELLVSRIEESRHDLRPRGRCMQTARRRRDEEPEEPEEPEVMTRRGYHLPGILSGKKAQDFGLGELALKEHIQRIASQLYAEVRGPSETELHFRVLLQRRAAPPPLKRKRTLTSVNTRLECVESDVWDGEERNDRCRAAVIAFLLASRNIFPRDICLLLAHMVWDSRTSEVWQKWDNEQRMWKK